MNTLRRFWQEQLVPRLPAAAQLAALIVVALALLYPAPFTSNLLPASWAGSDLGFSHWPFALLIQRTFAQNARLPLWNPYFGGGQPLGANPLAALFYPPTQLVHFLSLRDYFLVLLLGHLVLAGLGTLLLARRVSGLPRLPALVAAVSYMATPRLIAHLGAGHVTLIQTVAWYPWLALGCWATVRDPRRWGAAFALAIALTLLAGHPQMAYYGLLMTAVLAVWLLAKRWRQEGLRAAFASVAGLAAAGGIGALLAAIHLVPLMELASHSTRQVAVSSQTAVNSIEVAYPSLRHFVKEFFDPRPPYGSVWESMVTPGLAVLALAGVAALASLRKVWPMLLTIVIVAGLALGNISLLYRVVARYLPEMNLFRDPTRIWFLALFLFALLAGIGADALIRSAQRVWSHSKGLIGVLTLVVVAASLVGVDVGYGYARVGDANVIGTPDALARSAGQLAGSGRIYAVQENILQANAVEMQVPLADGWDPLLLQSYVSYMNRAGGYTTGGYELHVPAFDYPWLQPDARLLGLMNVSVVVSRRPMTDPRLVLAGEEQGTLIYKNTAVAGPAYLVNPGSDGNVPSLKQASVLDNSVRALALTPEQETFTFATSTTAYLVIAMPSFPGWNVELDGHAAPVQLFAGVMPAIKVGPGTHTVSYTYAPLSVRLGGLISAVGLLAALAWFLAGRFWRRRKPGGSRRGEKPDTESSSTHNGTDRDVSLVGEN